MKNENGEEWQIWQLTGVNDRIQIASMDDADLANDFVDMANREPMVNGACYYWILVIHETEE